MQLINATKHPFKSVTCSIVTNKYIFLHYFIFFFIRPENSYSRQNLLSSGSCKSNEVEQPQVVQITHNNLPSTATGNKFRNQINQNTPPDVLNINQQRHYHGILDNYNTNSRDCAMGKVRTTEFPANGQSKNGTFSEYIDNAQASGVSVVGAIPSNSSSESNLLNSVANHNNNENR